CQKITTFPASRLLALTSSISCWTFLSLDMWVLFLELLLATLHGEVLSLIQAVLQVLDCNLEVLLHPLQVSTGVLLLLQLLSHHAIKMWLIIPAPDLSIKSLPVNFTLDLVELQLDAENLGLFMFQSALERYEHTAR
uniref:Uncharacterized protein n=1 Tax=Xiphophorus couchianus TaxID=32473 RepID=A0A3B5LVS6_9TELE